MSTDNGNEETLKTLQEMMSADEFANYMMRDEAVRASCRAQKEFDEIKEEPVSYDLVFTDTAGNRTLLERVKTRRGLRQLYVQMHKTNSTQDPQDSFGTCTVEPTPKEDL